MKSYTKLTGRIIAVMIGMSLGLATGCGSGAGTDTVDDGGTNDASSIPIDNDGDGYTIDQDCNDWNDQIYPGTYRACQSACDYGTQVCLLTGEYHTCSARTDCTCDNPGDTRVVDCGNCGESITSCGLDLMWTFPDDCQNQGPCAPGEVGEETCPECGTGTRVCNDTCTWGPTEGCYLSCMPGVVETTSDGCTNPYERRQIECINSCELLEITPCTVDCLIQARTGTSDYKDEVCVQAGPAIIGSDDYPEYPEQQPKHSVDLSAYLIDVYEVTNGRYRECFDAGVCTQPMSLMFDDGSVYDDYPLFWVSYDQALTFCDWDGGRTLPTEAQWEKAARGPAPSEVPEPWGSDPVTCSRATFDGCSPDQASPVYAATLGLSHYGLYEMGGNVREWCLDYYDPSYYATSPTLDPMGPGTGTERVVRGFDYDLYQHLFIGSATFRMGESDYSGHGYYHVGFRCARAAF